MNPAIAFIMTLIYPQASQWKSSWIFFLMPFAGSFTALMFFNLVYKNTTENLKAVEEEEEEHNREEALLEN